MSQTRGIITTVFVTLCCSVRVTLADLASVKQCKDATYSIPNRVLAGHAILTEPSPGIEDCVILCIERDPLCESINYYRKRKVCELNNKTIDSNPEDMVDFEWTIYMTNTVRLLLYNEFDLECGRQTDICHLERGGIKCKACNGALGLESGGKPDAAITASSYYDNRFTPNRVRLHSPTAWIIADHPGPHWLQVDLGRSMAIKKAATQGRHDSHPQWVTSYTISSRVDGNDWLIYTESDAVKVFQGNTDTDTVISHVLQQHVRARFVKILPKSWYRRISMRAELYGCSLE